MITIDQIRGIIQKFKWVKTDYLAFNTSASAPTTHSEGQLHWNSEDDTLEMDMTGGVVHQQIGHEIFVPKRVKNTTGSDMSNGDLVYISGGTGSNALVKLADCSTYATSMGTIAMLTEDIDNGQFGWATTFGLVRDVDTSGMTIGDPLYLSTSGGFTTTAPVHPCTRVKVGTVFKVSADEGVVFVKIIPPVAPTVIAGSEDVVYDDIYMPITISKLGVTAPSWTPFAGNLSQYTFAVNDYVEGSFELKHNYKEGTDLDIHVHIVTNGAEASKEVRYSLEYWVGDMNETGSTDTLTSIDFAIANTDRYHHYLDIGDIPGSSLKIGAVVCFLLKRVALADGTGPSADPFVVSLGCHYQIDSLGSRNETSKG